MRSGRVLPLAVAAATVVALLASGGATATPQPREPRLALVAGPPSVTLTPQFDGSVSLDLGIYLVADGSPFVVRATRSSYSDPIVATQVLPGPDRRLPEGVLTDFFGFPELMHLTLEDGTGETAFELRAPFCPGVRAVRARPQARPATPYPTGCSSNPFALGAVWGLPAGWAAPALPLTLFDSAFDVPAGSYTATVSIDPRYRDMFGIPDHAASATVAVEVSGGALAAPETAAEAATGPDRHGGLDRHRGSDRHGGPATVAGLPATGAGDPDGGPRVPRRWRPDLRTLPAFFVQLAPGPGGAGDQLRFAATIWNAGRSPLVVQGFRRPGEHVLDAYQYFSDPRGRPAGFARAGTLEWDIRPGHDHWHFDDFARYRLRDADGRIVLPGTKVSYCIVSTDPIDLTIRHAQWRPVFDAEQFFACEIEPGTTMSLQQMLDVGFGDTYTPELPGQSFDVTDLPNGTYYVEVEANPDRVLYETDTTNNTSLRKIILGGEPGARTLEVPPHQGIDK